MKTKLIATLFVSAFAISGVSQAAITIGMKNFTNGTTAGVPIVDAAGAAVALNSIYISAGIFTTLPNFSTDSASTILGMFSALDLTPMVNATYTGFFIGNDTTTLASYASGWQGANAYFVVGNNSTLLNSTKIAVYHTSTPSDQVYATPAAGIANTQMIGAATTGWVYGLQTPVTVQPAGGTLVPANVAFVNGMQLISSPVPEPSAALLGALGALGLLRRRRI